MLAEHATSPSPLYFFWAKDHYNHEWLAAQRASCVLQEMVLCPNHPRCEEKKSPKVLWVVQCVVMEFDHVSHPRDFIPPWFSVDFEFMFPPTICKSMETGISSWWFLLLCGPEGYSACCSSFPWHWHSDPNMAILTLRFRLHCLLFLDGAVGSHIL